MTRHSQYKSMGALKTKLRHPDRSATVRNPNWVSLEGPSAFRTYHGLGFHSRYLREPIPSWSQRCSWLTKPRDRQISWYVANSQHHVMFRVCC